MVNRPRPNTPRRFDLIYRRPVPDYPQGNVTRKEVNPAAEVFFLGLVEEIRFELTRSIEQQILSLWRLPVPPLLHKISAS